MTMTAILIFLGVYFIFDVIYTINNIIQIMQGSFKLYSTWRWSYIFALQKLYCCYAAVILYSPPKLGEAQYHLRSKYNWRSQYNSPKANITEKNPNFEMLRPPGSFLDRKGVGIFTEGVAWLFMPINTQNRPLCYLL